MSRDKIPQHVLNKDVCREDGEGSIKVTYHGMDRILGHIADMKLSGMASLLNLIIGEQERAKLVATTGAIFPH